MSGCLSPCVDKFDTVNSKLFTRGQTVWIANSPQYENANIPNFVLAVPLEKK